MKPITKLAVPFLSQPAVRDVLEALNPPTRPMAAMIVGGAVRHVVCGYDDFPSDIDIATVWTPDQVMKMAQSASIAVHPTGLAHGTVTLVCRGMGFQVTTLRRDVETDGRHAVVAYTDDWQVDAARRDFTMNTLLLDRFGTLYDPLGRGYADALARRIVFVGQAQDRIQEDALRLLRYFRFMACWGDASHVIPSNLARVLRRSAPLLQGLSVERIDAEMHKLLMGAQVQTVLRHIFRLGVLSDFPRHRLWQMRLARVVALNDTDVTLRYWAILPSGQSPDTRYTVMTRMLHKSLKAYWGIEQILRAHRFSLHGIHLAAYRHNITDTMRIYTIMRGDRLTGVDVRVPVFPVRAADLALLSGAALGRALKDIEKRWIASDFTLDKKALLQPFCMGRQGH